MRCCIGNVNRLNYKGVFHLLKIRIQPSPELAEGKGGYGFDKLSLLALKAFETHPNYNHYSRTLAGIISLIDLVSATVAAKRPQESMAALQRIDDIFVKMIYYGEYNKCLN